MLEVLSHHRTSFSPMQNSNEPQDGRRLPPIATQLSDIFKKNSRPSFPVTPDSANDIKRASPVKRKREESGSGDERHTEPKRQMTTYSPDDPRRKLSGSWQQYPPRHSNVPSPAQPHRILSPTARSETSATATPAHVRLPSMNAQSKAAPGSTHTSPLVSPLTRNPPTSMPTSPPTRQSPREPLPPLADQNRSSNTISLPPIGELARHPHAYRGNDEQTSSKPGLPSLQITRRLSGDSRPPLQSPMTDRFYPSDHPPPQGAREGPPPYVYDSGPQSARSYDGHPGGPPFRRSSDGYGSGHRPPPPPPPPPPARPPPADARPYEGYPRGPPAPYASSDRPDYSRPPAPPQSTHKGPPHPYDPHFPPPHHPQPAHMPYGEPYNRPYYPGHEPGMARLSEPGQMHRGPYQPGAGSGGLINWDVNRDGDPYNRKRRGNLPKESTAILNNWFLQHIDHPYPKEEEKQSLQSQTNLTMSQISNWFINARRRRRPTALQRAPGGLEWDRQGP